MKKSLYILFILFYSASLSAQFEYKPIAKEGKYWFYLNYTIINGTSFYKSTDGFMLTIEGDSIVNNKKYKKIYNYKMAGQHCGVGPCWYFDYPYKKLDKSFYGLIRDDSVNMKVYYYYYKNACYEGEELEILNFRTHKGDSLNSCLSNILNSTNRVLVEGSEFDWAYKKFRRNIKYHAQESNINGYSSIVCYEGVGSSTVGILKPGFYWSELVDFCEGTLEECNFVTSNQLLFTDSPKFKVFPNPATDHLNIVFSLRDHSSKETELVLYDLAGKEVQRMALQESENISDIEVSHLPSGIYTLHLQIEGRTMAVEKLVVVR